MAPRVAAPPADALELPLATPASVVRAVDAIPAAPATDVIAAGTPPDANPGAAPGAPLPGMTPGYGPPPFVGIIPRVTFPPVPVVAVVYPATPGLP